MIDWEDEEENILMLMDQGLSREEAIEYIEEMIDAYYDPDDVPGLE